MKIWNNVGIVQRGDFLQFDGVDLNACMNRCIESDTCVGIQSIMGLICQMATNVISFTNIIGYRTALKCTYSTVSTLRK